MLCSKRVSVDSLVQCFYHLVLLFQQKLVCVAFLCLLVGIFQALIILKTPAYLCEVGNFLSQRIVLLCKPFDFAVLFVDLLSQTLLDFVASGAPYCACSTLGRRPSRFWLLRGRCRTRCFVLLSTASQDGLFSLGRVPLDPCSVTGRELFWFGLERYSRFRN